MTIFTLLYVLNLSQHLAMAWTIGNQADRQSSGLFVIMFAMSHVAVRLAPQEAVLVHFLMYTFAAFASYVLTERWYGDIAGMIFAVIGVFAAASFMGLYSIEYGKGVSMTFWHIHALLMHMALIGGSYGLWTRATASA